MKVMKRRLEWLGHLARMPDHRIPKICLFSWLPQPRPRGGPRLRWRDIIRKDLKAIGVSEDRWYDEASVSRPRWRTAYKKGLESLSTNKKPRNIQATRYSVTNVRDPLEGKATRSVTSASWNDRSP